IPRLIWPNKPVAGSGGLVTRFTGVEFAEGTSVGVGPILELYGNFGEFGVILGFVVLGCAIRAIDLSAGILLRAGRWGDFAVWFLVGISLMNVGGSFVECAAGTVASIVLGNACNRILRSRGWLHSEDRRVLVAAPL